MHNKKKTKHFWVWCASNLVFPESNTSAVLWIWAYVLLLTYLLPAFFGSLFFHISPVLYQTEKWLMISVRPFRFGTHCQIHLSRLLVVVGTNDSFLQTYSIFFSVWSVSSVYLQYLMRIPLRHLTQILSFHLWTSTGFTTIEKIWTVNFKARNIPVFIQLTCTFTKPTLVINGYSSPCWVSHEDT